MVCILVLALCIWVYKSITTLYIAHIGHGYVFVCYSEPLPYALRLQMCTCHFVLIHTVNIDKTDNKDQYQQNICMHSTLWRLWVVIWQIDNVFIFQPLVHINVKVILQWLVFFVPFCHPSVKPPILPLIVPPGICWWNSGRIGPTSLHVPCAVDSL